MHQTQRGCIRAVTSSAVEMVFGAVSLVARQQVVEKNPPAFTVLLDQGYRAGVCVYAGNAVPDQ